MKTLAYKQKPTKFVELWKVSFQSSCTYLGTHTTTSCIQIDIVLYRESKIPNLAYHYDIELDKIIEQPLFFSPLSFPFLFEVGKGLGYLPGGSAFPMIAKVGGIIRDWTLVF